MTCETRKGDLVSRISCARWSIAPGAFGAVGSLVWVDENSDGVFQEDEPRLPGVTLTLTRANGQTTTTQTNEAGEAFLGSLAAGLYRLCVTAGLPAGAAPAVAADRRPPHAGCSSFTLGRDEVDLTRDFAYQGAAGVRPTKGQRRSIRRNAIDRGRGGN